MRPVVRLRNLSCLVIGLAAVAGGTLASVAPSAATASTPARPAANSVPIYLNPAYPPAERAADLVSRMTTAEKAEEMDSSEAPAIPGLGVAPSDVVRVSQGGKVLTAVGPGPATITATVRYHGATATGSVVVYVQ